MQSCTLSILLIPLFGTLEVWHLFALTFLLSSVSSLYSPAFEASIPNLVDKSELITANSLFSIAKSFISLGGPVNNIEVFYFFLSESIHIF